jgi:FkbM family methyltransferase
MKHTTIRALCATTRRVPVPGLTALAARLIEPGRAYPDLVIPWGRRSRVWVNWANSREWDLYCRGIFEPHVTAAIRRHTPPGGQAIDIGANVGLHTLTLSRAVGPAGRVLALEPNEPVCRRLAQNLALNAHAANVTVRQVAASDRAGWVAFYAPADRPITGKASLVEHGEPGWAESRVEAASLDDLVEREGWPRVDIVKCDVEGHDLQALMGARRILADHQPVVLVEFEPDLWARAGSDYPALYAYLDGLGYGLWFLPPHRLRGLMRPAPVALGPSLPPALAGRKVDLLALPRPHAAGGR